VRRASLFAVCAVIVGCRTSHEEIAFKLRVAAVGPLTPLTPAEQRSSSIYAQEWVFETVLRTARDGSPIGGLASRFEFLDPAHARVELRSGARFSDGSPVTVEDVRTSLTDSNLDVRGESRALTIESRSGAAVEPLLRHTRIYKRVGDAYLGSGPFRVTAQDANQLVLDRIEHVPGKIDEVVLVAFATPRDTFARTLAGDADLAVLQDAKQSEFFNGVDRLRVIRGPGANAIAVGMGLRRLSRSARKAIALALPRDDLGRLVFGEHCATMPPPPADGGAMPTRRLDVEFLGNDLQMERMALAVARALGPAGGDARSVPIADALAQLKSQDFDLLLVRPLVWPPSAAAIVWATDSPYNQFGYSNPRVDAALKAGDWARALQDLQEDPPVVFICTPERLAVVDSRVKNPRVGPYGYLETLPDWEIAE
jgi:ABC-type transport system substrate-binding protein